MLAGVAIFCSCVFWVVSKQCYWNSKCSYAYFGSKTVYEDVRGDIRDVPEIQGCNVVAVWSLMRHGSRLPSHSNIANMKRAALLKDGIVTQHLFEKQGDLCSQDISNLQQWSWDGHIDKHPGYLTMKGYREIYDLGTRFQEKYQDLLQNLEHYQFRPSPEQRTIKSASAFIQGLSQEYMLFKNFSDTNWADILKPYIFCAKYKGAVSKEDHSDDEVNSFHDSNQLQKAHQKHNKMSKKRSFLTKTKKEQKKYALLVMKAKRYAQSRNKREMKKYHKTQEYIEMLNRVQKRAGLNDHLTSANASALYDLCRFGRASTATRTSPWCALFTDQDLIILEYLNDIRHYYRNGYGSIINMRLAGPTLKDLYENFHSIASINTTSFTSYFTHDSLLQKVFTALGLFQDYPGLSGFVRIEGRQWRTSFLTPFAANFVAVLHKCSQRNGTVPLNRVQFFINEQELHLCGSRTCSWNQFQYKFSPFVDSNMEICNLNHTSNRAIPDRNIADDISDVKLQNTKIEQSYREIEKSMEYLSKKYDATEFNQQKQEDRAVMKSLEKQCKNLQNKIAVLQNEIDTKKQ